MPYRPKSSTSCVQEGLITGTALLYSENSLWCGMEELFEMWSSPARAMAPQFSPVPAKLAWRMASPLRSRPGPLPYQIPTAPS